jgi:hypothetical protein
MDLKNYSDNQIDQWIKNHEEKSATASELYRRLLEERARRQSSGLNVENSLRHLIAAAKAGRFTTYGDLAAASNVPWGTARYAMNGQNGHLDRLLDICHARHIPLLTAICVNQQNIRTGKLSAESLKGFIKGAQRVGYSILNEEEFLRDCQKQCFEWAKTQDEAVTATH